MSESNTSGQEQVRGCLMSDICRLTSWHPCNRCL